MNCSKQVVQVVLSFLFIFLLSCNTMMKRDPSYIYNLNERAKQVLLANMQTQKEWIKVHAAEFLLWSEYPEGVALHFMEEEQKFGVQSPYRIGIWRVLAQAGTNSEIDKKWSEKILQAFIDEQGKDRIHAAESLAKLKLSPPNEYREVTKRALSSQINKLSLYTRWSIGYSNENTLLETQNFFVDLAISEEVEKSLRSLAAYVIQKSGVLNYKEWQTFAIHSLAESHDSEIRINLLCATLISAPDEIKDGKLYKDIFDQFLNYKQSKNLNDLIKLSDGLSVLGRPDDIDVLIPFINNNSFLGSTTTGIDLSSYAAYAILMINRRYFNRH